MEEEDEEEEDEEDEETSGIQNELAMFMKKLEQANKNGS